MWEKGKRTEGDGRKDVISEARRCEERFKKKMYTSRACTSLGVVYYGLDQINHVALSMSTVNV